MTFVKWFKTFNEEKGIDPDEVIVVEGKSGPNHIPLAVLFDVITKDAPKSEQEGIKKMLVMLDFKNANIRDYYRHLAKAIAK
jgi:hypothetical protein